MEALKASLALKRKAAGEELAGKKYAKRSEIEEIRLRRKREEEHQELAEKERLRVARQRSNGSGDLPRMDSGMRMNSEEALSSEEVIRRLRLLAQPATLFGEEEPERAARLKQAKEEYAIDDDTLGGQQGNTLLELIRSGKLKKKAPVHRRKAAEAAKQAEQAAARQAADGAGPSTDADVLEGETEAAFRAAAERVKAQQQEAKQPVEDRIVKCLKGWCAEWQADMDARPADVQDSSSGYVGTVQFKQTMAFFDPLYKLLKKRQIIPEMKAGLWLICQACQERNYVAAADIYMRLAIGNNPWPIGVTQIGIHDRSAREKISHSMNGAAHIMNDEATRKYLQAIKRLMTFLQRCHPTDPSRCVDFDAYRDPGRGAAGSGSEKAALIEAERRGENWKALGLLPAPHLVGSDGDIRVPHKWENIVRGSEAWKEHQQQQRAAAAAADGSHS